MNTHDIPAHINEAWLWERCIPEPNTGCWLWLGARDTGGYGVLKYDINGTRRYYGIHRIALTLATGPIEPGHVVMHRCDNPPCINPAHLMAGTHAENNADRDQKGRHRWVEPEDRARGERQGLAKLTADLVLSIRARAAEGETKAAIARDLGVSDVAVGLVVRRKAWGHVP